MLRLCLLLLLATAVWADLTWSPPDKSFTAVFPAQPMVELDKTRASYETKTGYWRVTWRDIKPLTPEECKGRLQSAAKAVCQKMPDATITPGTTSQGHPCVDIAGKMEGADIYMRLIEVGPRGYNLHCYFDQAAAQKFFESFQVR